MIRIKREIYMHWNENQHGWQREMKSKGNNAPEMDIFYTQKDKRYRKRTRKQNEHAQKKENRTIMV